RHWRKPSSASERRFCHTITRSSLRSCGAAAAISRIAAASQSAAREERTRYRGHSKPTSGQGRERRRRPARFHSIEELAAENRALQQRLAELTEEATRNVAILRKTQERELDLLRAGSLAQLIDRLIDGLRESYQLDGVTLVLHDPQHEIRHLLWGD